MEDEELVTLSEIAKRMDVSRQVVSLWTRRQDPSFPESRPTVRYGRAREGYVWSEVQEFCLSHGLPDHAMQAAARRIARQSGKRRTT